jgi:hypothetical protein
LQAKVIFLNNPDFCPLIYFPLTFHVLIVSHKFPESTVAGLYKRAVSENQYLDAVRFGSQKINWTLKEFDVKLHYNSFTIEIFFCFRFWPS